MTERKPPGVSWRTWIDRQIEQGRAHGAFDDLPGQGKPLPGIDRPRDEMWWVREKLKREDVEYLPPALVVKRERQDALAEAMRAPTIDAARAILEAMNARIRYVNSHVIEGPPSTSVVIDIDEVLGRWVAPAPPEPLLAGADGGSGGPLPARRWWAVWARFRNARTSRSPSTDSVRP